MLIIKNANLISMEEINYEICDILVEDGLIKGIGKYDVVDYPEARVIDACGRYVTPGLVDPHCHVGLIESTIGWAGSDVNEINSPITPELRGIDGVKPHDECFAEALNSGVTTVCAGPGSANLIGGTFCALKTKGKTVDEIPNEEDLLVKNYLLSTGHTNYDETLSIWACLLIGVIISISASVSTFIIIQNTKVDLIKIKDDSKDEEDDE